MEILILGTGCANCNRLERLVAEVAQELGLVDPIREVSDIEKILTFEVLSTPALVVDGRVKVAGRVPAKDEVKQYLQGGPGEAPKPPCGGNGGCCAKLLG